MTAYDRETRFTELAHAVGPHLRRYVLRRAGAGVVDDVLADTMLVLWRRLDDVPADDPLPWCYAVARGCLANAQRSGRRQQRLVDKLAAAPVDPPAGDDAPLHDALAKLPETDRELVRLWAWEQLQPVEIAVVLGISANAVSIRLHRARGKFVEELRKIDGGAGHEGLREGRET